MKKTSAAFGALLILLAACASEPTAPGTFSRVLSPKIAMDVKIISLADRSGAQPLTSPYKTNKFSPTIAEAVKQWAVDRLQANGKVGQAIIIVKNASLTVQSLPVKDGVEGWFTRDQSLKYTGRAEVTVEANGSGGFAVADASATRSVTLPEDPTEQEKQDAYATLLNGLMKDLGENLEQGIREHMGRFLTAPPVYGVTAIPDAAQPDAGQ